MNVTIALWVGLAVTIFLACLLAMTALERRRNTVDERLRVVTAKGLDPVIQATEEVDEGSRLSLVTRIMAPLRGMFGLSTDQSVAQNLSNIGYGDPIYTDLYYAAKILGPALSAVVAGTVFTHDPLFAFFAMGTLSFFLPDLWLTARVTRWRHAIRVSLPDALDLLVITMEAGLGLDQALLRVATEMKHSHPELAAEFLTINLEQRAGKRRLEAWHHMADRTQLDVIRAFTNMLLQTERFGTPIATALGKYADAMRTHRRQQAEELAAKTSIKLVFPLVLFIFPSMFIVMLAPAIISIVEGMAKSFQQ